MILFFFLQKNIDFIHYLIGPSLFFTIGLGMYADWNTNILKELFSMQFYWFFYLYSTFVSSESPHQRDRALDKFMCLLWDCILSMRNGVLQRHIEWFTRSFVFRSNSWYCIYNMFFCILVPIYSTSNDTNLSQNQKGEQNSNARVILCCVVYKSREQSFEKSKQPFEKLAAFWSTVQTARWLLQHLLKFPNDENFLWKILTTDIWFFSIFSFRMKYIGNNTRKYLNIFSAYLDLFWWSQQRFLWHNTACYPNCPYQK